MSPEEAEKLRELIQKALKEKRSKEEITKTFKEAGIITEKGNLKAPYKEIYIPASK